MPSTTRPFLLRPFETSITVTNVSFINCSRTITPQPCAFTTTVVHSTRKSYARSRLVIVIAICRVSRVLRLLWFLSFFSAVPPLADIDLRFEPGMAAGIDRVRFHFCQGFYRTRLRRVPAGMAFPADSSRPSTLGLRWRARGPRGMVFGLISRNSRSLGTHTRETTIATRGKPIVPWYRETYT